MSDDSGSILRRLFDTLNDHDLDALEELHADDYELLDVASGETFRGRDGARRNADGWLTAFPDMHVELTTVVSSGEWAAAECHATGTHDGPLATPGGDVPATGRHIDGRFATFVQARDGKIVAGRDYYDAMTIMSQLGLMPETEAASTG